MYACCHTRLIVEIIEANGFDSLPRRLNKKVLVAINGNYVISLILEEKNTDLIKVMYFQRSYFNAT